MWKRFHRHQEENKTPLSPLLFNIELEVLARTIRQETQIKRVQCGKDKVQVLLFWHGTILCIRELKDSLGKFFELINNFSEISRYKINTQKYLTSPDTNNSILRKKSQKQSKFKIATEHEDTSE